MLSREVIVNKPKVLRAYYIGGFGVGTGVPRVMVLERIPAGTYLSLMTSYRSDQYRVRVVSKHAYGYVKGEEFYCLPDYLYDSISFVQGPRLHSFGKTWLELFSLYDEARRAYENERR